MALVIAFKPKPREAGARDAVPNDTPFTLLFFTGVQYERMADEEPRNPETKIQMPRRSRQRLKA